MTAPTLWALPVLKGHLKPLEVALDGLDDDAFRFVAPRGNHAVFVGDDELCVEVDDPDMERFSSDAWTRDEAQPLLAVLEEHTVFDRNKPYKFLIRDVHHAGEPVVTPEPAAWEG